jgi:hypothetical protein
MMSHNVNRNKCNRCRWWTKRSVDCKFKCYAGFCPAKLRDEIGRGDKKYGTNTKNSK